ncbi:blast:Putative U5 small nuclear ribonucleoprotein 200 kDa helicase [Drosophila guanche]|uniref:Blast:Putative U5 small nuclear ribonucleoprotein 200 kDa helicase n=1 Tax=Drosophila guanche TaxID=7266 RepID=A0A3B0JTH7_DROGU|nr:blast:Putative U5 small nuclear ribonucleoprotein 200 kDa helicase [Drosophila guanche]
MESLANYRYSLVAGACAAGGSFFGKLPSHLSAQKLMYFPDSGGSNFSDSSYLEFGLLRLLPLVLMVLCNVCNLRCFLKALQMTEQTLTCVVLTAASNYVLSCSKTRDDYVPDEEEQTRSDSRHAENLAIEEAASKYRIMHIPIDAYWLQCFLSKIFKRPWCRKASLPIYLRYA